MNKTDSTPIEDKLHRGISCHCKRCYCRFSEFCFNKCNCIDCTHRDISPKSSKKPYLTDHPKIPIKGEFESVETFIIRLINYYLDLKVTSMPDISTLIRKKYGYSSSQVSSAKKKLTAQLLGNFKILDNPNKRQGKSLYGYKL